MKWCSRFVLSLLFAFIGTMVIVSCGDDDSPAPEEVIQEDEGTTDEDTSGDESSGEESDGETEEGDTGGDGEDSNEDGSGEDGEDSEDGDSNQDEDGDGSNGEDGSSEEGDSNQDEDGSSGEDGGSEDGDSGDNNDDEAEEDGGTDTGDGNEGQEDGSDDNDGSDGDTDNDETPDNVPPTIVFVAPQNNQTLQEGANIMVVADVIDDVSVSNARLFVNGVFVRQESVTPYEWGANPNDTALMNMLAGSYELRIVATDSSGNTNEASIMVLVEEAAMDDDNNDDGTDGNSDDADCSAENVVFNEANGLVAIEFEKGNFTEEWFLRTQEPGFTGQGYMVWEGTQRFSNPAFGRSTFKIRITNPGTYQFIWRSAVTIGDSGSEHNDTWLRFADAADFFGQKRESIVFPNDTGKTPNPNGSSRDGFFKIFRSGSDLSFKWQSKTSDNDGHDIFVVFDSPGVYTMDIAARSSGHAIDKFVLFDTSISSDDAINFANTSDSQENCQ